MADRGPVPLVVIACGGTGGHLFPGVALGRALMERGVDVLLMTSTKAVDREAVRSAGGMQVEVLEAVGLDPRRPWRFVRGMAQAWGRTLQVFRVRRPDAVVSMGGFCGVAPVLVARRLRVRTFLHESNAVPGRANRWLARGATAVFAGYRGVAGRLRCRAVHVCGTPVRSEIRPSEPGSCRVRLGLGADRPTLVVMGGSQGARAVNRMVMGAMEGWARQLPALQYVHLTGDQDHEEVVGAYGRLGLRAVVHRFLAAMPDVLGAADLAVSRAGASSIAECAAAAVPSVLIPLPTAVDNHQHHNALALAEAGAAMVCAQGEGAAERLERTVVRLMSDAGAREAMRAALARWHRPGAAAEMAEFILTSWSRAGRGS
jgi:UDP-N-acetylglucosamine--N-acetylmuramyl-(pentapeptide) pyrophosphoryl-undecaprenol N-acetylglucosamine transferase